MPDSSQWKALVIGLAASCLLGEGAAAESALLVDPPDEIGVIPAATYDVQRRKVGAAHLVVEKLDDGRLRMLSDSGFTGGARTVMSALLRPVDGTGKLRPVFQESRSFDAEGRPLGRLSIDHEARLARCQKPDGALAGEIELPEEDHVANVTLSLLFLPLVRRDEEELSFQIFLCSGGSKLVDFVANLSPASRNGKRPHVIEVRYGPDFGIASMIARNFIPKLSVWFAPESPYPWVAHRVPLYGNGPEVYIVREGVPTRWLADD
jgi:hypothetical protein